MIQEATLGAGCFWCIEACFKDLQGVQSVSPGYSGGTSATANYRDVCSGTTKHAEVARVVYDDSIISFDKLLEMFWTFSGTFPDKFQKCSGNFAVVVVAVVVVLLVSARRLCELIDPRNLPSFLGGGAGLCVLHRRR